MSNPQRRSRDPGKDLASAAIFKEVVLWRLPSPYSTWKCHPPNYSEKTLGVISDSPLFLTLHHFSSRNIWLVLPSKHIHALITLPHFSFYHHQATVKCHLSYCNSFLTGLSLFAINSHQSGQKIPVKLTSRVVTPTVKFYLRESKDSVLSAASPEHYLARR